MLFPRQHTNKTLKVFASCLLYGCPLSGRVHDNAVAHHHSTGGTLVFSLRAEPWWRCGCRPMSVMTVLSNKIIHGASDPPATSVAVGENNISIFMAGATFHKCHRDFRYRLILRSLRHRHTITLSLAGDIKQVMYAL